MSLTFKRVLGVGLSLAIGAGIALAVQVIVVSHFGTADQWTDYSVPILALAAGFACSLGASLFALTRFYSFMGIHGDDTSPSGNGIDVFSKTRPWEYVPPAGSFRFKNIPVSDVWPSFFESIKRHPKLFQGGMEPGRVLGPRGTPYAPGLAKLDLNNAFIRTDGVVRLGNRRGIWISESDRNRWEDSMIFQAMLYKLNQAGFKIYGESDGYYSYDFYHDNRSADQVITMWDLFNLLGGEFLFELWSSVKDQMTLFQFLKENSSVARVFYAAINDFLQRLKDAGGFDDFMARLKSMRVPVAPEGFLPVGPATAFYLNGEYFTLSFPKGKKRSLEVNSRKSINYYRWKGRAVVYFRKSGKIEINASARADDLAVIQLKTRRGHMMARVVKGEGFYYTSGQGSADKDYDADTSLAFNMLDFVIDNLSHDPAQLNTGGIDFRAGTVPLAVAGDGRGVISFDNDLEFIKRMQNIKGFSPVMMGMFLVDDLDDFSKNGFWGHRGR